MYTEIFDVADVVLTVGRSQPGRCGRILMWYQGISDFALQPSEPSNGFFALRKLVARSSNGFDN
jgi:hypothetical protein